jgi:hypothetical protein
MGTLEFVKNLWGGMGIPGANPGGVEMPGMNLAGMSTLSVEEIQKRIADLKAVENWLAMNMNMLRSTIQALEVQAATIATLQSMGNAFAATMAPGAAQDKEQAPGGASAAPNGASGNGHDQSESGGAQQNPLGGMADAAAPLANAAAWWGMLQNQFAQAVNQALAGPAQSADGKNKDEAGPEKGAGAGTSSKRKPAK